MLVSGCRGPRRGGWGSPVRGCVRGALRPSSASGCTLWPQSFRERGGSRPGPEVRVAPERWRRRENRHWHLSRSNQSGGEASCSRGPPPSRPGARAPLPGPVGSAPPAPSASRRCCFGKKTGRPHARPGEECRRLSLKRHFIGTFLVAADPGL